MKEIYPACYDKGEMFTEDIIKIEQILRKHLPQECEKQKELDDRDNDLANIFNTTETK
jgi:hypothetical protein